MTGLREPRSVEVHDLHELITEYEISALPVRHPERSHLALFVRWRNRRADGTDLYAVMRWSKECWGTDGGFDYESIPSERRDEWMATHRFPLEEALRLAREIAPTLTINGYTVADCLKMHEGWEVDNE